LLFSTNDSFGPDRHLRPAHASQIDELRTGVPLAICAFTEEVPDDRGLRFVPIPLPRSLAAYDIIVVPGGFGTRALQHDKAFIQWLGSAAPVKLKTSVCTGALLLGSAGFLAGKTGHNASERFRGIKALLAATVVVDHRIVDEGGVVTAQGVTSSIDLGLTLLNGLQVAKRGLASPSR